MTYDILLSAHIAGAFLLLAGIGVQTATGARGSRTTNVATMRDYVSMRMAATKLGNIPGALLLIITGTVLALHVGHSFSSFWLVGAYVLWVLALAIDVAIMGPAEKRLLGRADELAAEGITESEELQALANEPRVKAAGGVLHLITVAFIVLMVFRPTL